jgi:hypothetical protein
MLLCALEKLRPRRSAQPRVRGQWHSAQKFLGTQPLLAFELDLEQLEPRRFGTGNEKTMIINLKLA